MKITYFQHSMRERFPGIDIWVSFSGDYLDRLLHLIMHCDRIELERLRVLVDSMGDVRVFVQGSGDNFDQLDHQLSMLERHLNG